MLFRSKDLARIMNGQVDDLIEKSMQYEGIEFPKHRHIFTQCVKQTALLAMGRLQISCAKVLNYAKSIQAGLILAARQMDHRTQIHSERDAWQLIKGELEKQHRDPSAVTDRLNEKAKIAIIAHEILNFKQQRKSEPELAEAICRYSIFPPEMCYQVTPTFRKAMALADEIKRARAELAA